MTRGIRKEYKEISAKDRKFLDNWYDPYKKEIKEFCKEHNIYSEDAAMWIKFRHHFKIQEFYSSREMKEFLIKRKSLVGVTKEKFIFLYGESEGNERWNKYCSIQAETNTKEYKMRVHGMTSEEVDLYNASRAVTLENCIKRHGVKKGREVFFNYVDKQRDAGTSLNYFINKYGEELGTLEYKRICSLKKLCLDNFKNKYGEELGFDKYLSFINNQRDAKVSNKEQLFKKKVEDYLLENGLELGAYNFPIIHDNGYILVDYLSEKYRFAYEYNGILWHAKPTKYKAEDTPLLSVQGTKETAQEIWDRDKKRADIILNSGIVDKVFIVWEDDEESGYQEIKEYINECRNNT